MRKIDWSKVNLPKMTSLLITFALFAWITYIRWKGAETSTWVLPVASSLALIISSIDLYNVLKRSVFSFFGGVMLGISFGTVLALIIKAINPETLGELVQYIPQFNDAMAYMALTLSLLTLIVKDLKQAEVQGTIGQGK